MTAIDPEYAAVTDAVRRGERPLALQLAARALKRGRKQPLVLVLVAEGLEEQGQPAAAIDLLKAAAQAAPANKAPWMRLAGLLARQGRFEEALAAFDAVLKADADSFEASMGAGEMRLLVGDMPGAEAHYRRAVELRSDAAEPLAVLAFLAAQQQNPDEARRLASRASDLQPGVAGAELALARADLLEGQAREAAARLDKLLDRPDLSQDHRISALDTRGEALDALDRSAEAFADYEGRNGCLLRQNAKRFQPETAEHPADAARRLAAYLGGLPAHAWAAPDGHSAANDEGARTHVFLLGFPRSGTTLLEKALAGHPDVAILEEVDHLAIAGQGLRLDEAAWWQLARLTHAEAEDRRGLYWRGAREGLRIDFSGRILVDKLPLQTMDLPLIAKLFPQARILFAVRDPRDVVLSCFRRRFRLNPAMFEFLTLGGAARFYDAVMGVAKVARPRLALPLREVRHEAVIDDFDGEIAGILDFIGAAWDPAVRDFASRVRGARLRTPSYPQLAKGLNAEGVGQWRRYRDEMTPVLKILAPWVAAYGYPAR